MKRKLFHIILFILIGVALLYAPIFISNLLSKPIVSEYVNTTLKINNESFTAIIIDYFSLLISFVLAVFVFVQSERINRLQAIQYDTFFVVNDLDYSFSHGETELIKDRHNNDFSIAHVFSGEKKAVITSIVFGKGAGYALFLPLHCVTHNQQIITSLSIKEITVTIKGEDKKVLRKTVHADGEKINVALDNNTDFILGLGMVAPKKEINKVFLRFIIGIENQSYQKQWYCFRILLFHNSEGKYTIASSEVRKVQK